MSESLRLGRIFGVRVGLNWSVLFVFMLITLGLATGSFPELYPGYSGVVYLVTGLAAGVVFFLSLLAHELAHALVARRNGVEVEGITLWLFGGVAKLEGEPRDPGAELKIAGVGPLVSLVAAGMFAAVAMLLTLLGAADLTVGIFVWLALINVILAAFNLAPAAPLDGGRILRAVLWQIWGDRRRAATAASRSGQAFGGLLIGLGLFLFVAGAGVSGIWLALIGWFMMSTAQAEEEQAAVSDLLAGVRVRDVMTPEPVTVPADVTVAELLDDYVFRNRHSTFPVIDTQGRFAGLVTLSRVKLVPPAERGTTRVSQIACPVTEVLVAHPDDPILELLPRLAGCSDGRAVVLEGDRIVGIVSPIDVARQYEVAGLRAETGGHPR
ncbi:MAG: site-2 protease family protein [Acidimicrobiales bacterium]